jgi:transposase
VNEPIRLTADQRQDLRRQARRTVGRVSQRIHYVLLFARGREVEEIAEFYEVDTRTVLTWLERYRQGGVGALDDFPRSGRPRLATVAATLEATQCLEGMPADRGYVRTTWTRRLLRCHLAERLGCWLSVSSLTRFIRRLGFVWTRPKLITRGQDPLEAERKRAIAAVLAAYPQAPRLFEDECEVHRVPVVRGQYQRVGEQRTVATPGTNCRQSLFGFLNVLTGEWHYWLRARKRSIDFLECLQDLYRLYPQGPILLFLDNASIHKSKVTLRWLRNHPRFIVCYLPAYTGHQTNPVEKVWWALKDAIAANAMYSCLEAIEEAIVSFFATFSREDALRLTAHHEGERISTTGAWALTA